MNAQTVEIAWLDARETMTAAELARACGFTEAELAELIDYGAVRALPGSGATAMFSAEALPALRRAGRLRRDFDLDLFAIALLIEYLNRIDLLERQVRSLQAQVPLHPARPQRDGPQPWREPHGGAPP